MRGGGVFNLFIGMALVVAIIVATPARAAEETIFDYAQEPWKGDMDGILERGFIRIVTPYNPLFLHFVGGKARGLSVDISRAFEKHLAAKKGKRVQAPRVVILPVPRDRIFAHLAEGRADIAAANLTITPERAAKFTFSDPIITGIDEVVITGPKLGPITSLDDLGDTSFHVRKSSSYFEHLTALNAERKMAGRSPLAFEIADERLEDYDLLHLVDGGVLPAVIVDSHKAQVWAKVFDKLHVHDDIKINSGGEIAWAVRSDTPELLATVNEFVKSIRQGTLLGNILINRYYKTPPALDEIAGSARAPEFQRTFQLFKKYAEAYAFDWALIAAQGYQESKFRQATRSHAGAVGIMQVLPSTAADPNVGIEDITTPDGNIHAGVKYLRFLKDRYFADAGIDPLDRVLFAFAAYNAGPAAINRARKKSEKMGFDRDRWFDHVEVVASKSISREPAIYVRNIFKYYVVMKAALEAGAAKRAVEGPAGSQ